MEFDRDPTPRKSRKEFEQSLSGEERSVNATDTQQALDLLEALLEHYPECRELLTETMTLVRDSAESIESIRYGDLGGVETLIEQGWEGKSALTERSLELDRSAGDSSKRIIPTLLQVQLSLGNALSYVEQSTDYLDSPNEVVRRTRLAIHHYSDGIRRLLGELPKPPE